MSAPHPGLAGPAALNNAEWCDAVCRTHGLPGVLGPDSWVVPHRSPPRYPDVVTLRPDADDRFLERIDATGGASVKDSFATLDLTRHGFQVLFEAEWIHREAGGDAGAARPAEAVTTPDDLSAWAAAHGVGEVFRPALLGDPRVTILALRDRDGTIAGGAAVNRSARAAGVSNVFGTTIPLDEVWRAVLAFLPDVPLVGYESGDDLDLVERLGFRRIGPLRVWLRT